MFGTADPDQVSRAKSSGSTGQSFASTTRKQKSKSGFEVWGLGFRGCGFRAPRQVYYEMLSMKVVRRD